MKMNIFAANDIADTDAFRGRAARGNRAISLIDPEADLIAAIDEETMSLDEILVTRFTEFLGNNRLTLDTFEQQSEDEQERLRKEFKEINWDLEELQ
ncbi:Uncharacterised protein [uncultured archaeon]|nr:Uncharacterised protein [uncultured archaeon]